MRSTARVRPVTLDQVIERVRREYAALPGLRLTASQVSRVWGLDASASHDVLRRLVDGAFLRRTGSGHYERADVQRDAEINGEAWAHQIVQSRPSGTQHSR